MEDHKDPSIFISKWQEITDLLAKLIGIPSALIMKYGDEQLEVFVASSSANNPFSKGDKEKWHGLFCETVIKTQEKLLVSNARNDKRWTIKQDMIAYLGFPINFPDGTPFGTICVLDNKENPFSNDYEKLLSLFKNVVELDIAILRSNDYQETPVHNAKEMVIKQQQELFKAKKEADLHYTSFKKLFDSITDSVFLIDSGTGTIILANEPASKAYGYTQAELYGMNISGIDPNFQDSEKKALRKRLIEKGSAIFDTTHKTKDGRLIPVEVKTQQVDSNRFISVARDITDRKQMEDALRKANKRFELAVKGSNDGIWDWDLETNEFFLSERWKEQLGYKDDELKNDISTLIDNIHPEDKERISVHIDKFRRGELEKYDIEFRMIHKNGSCLWIRSRGMGLHDANGVPHRISGSHTDITDSKRLQIELQEKTNTLERFFDVNLDLLCIASISGDFIKLNKAWENTLGYSLSELEGHKFFDFIHPEDMQSTNEALSVLSEQEDVSSFVNRYRRKDGDYRYIEWRSHPVGETIYAAARDITARIENENRLKELNATKDKLFSIISHDLRSPFNALLGLSDLLVTNIEEYSQDEIRQFSEMLNDSANQAYRLLENLLSWSRMQTGTFKMNPAQVNPSELIYEITELMTPVANAKNIGLLSRVETNTNVFADPDMIKTVLRNLISNAIKFTHPGGTVTIETKPYRHNVLMIVSDTGIGIDKEHIPAIFSVDNKLSKVGTVKETGSGLGLMLCKEFVEKIGGNIWVESRLGEGSSFMFTVPAAT